MRGHVRVWHILSEPQPFIHADKWVRPRYGVDDKM